MDKESTKKDGISEMEKALVKKENELQTRYCQMGKSLLELADSEQKSIDSLVDEIIHLRRKLAAVKGEIQCTECMTYNAGGSKYCKYCGKRLPEADGKENKNEIHQRKG